MASRQKKPPFPPAAALRAIRLAAGMTQPQAAQAVSRFKKISLKHYKFIELGQAELKRAWAEAFAKAFNTTTQRIMFGDEDKPHIESSEVMSVGLAEDRPRFSKPRAGIPELDFRGGMGGGGVPSGEMLRDGSYTDAVKPDEWVFPPSYLREINAPATRLRVLESGGDSMYPTISSGDRLIVDTFHRQPTPDGIYALRDSFGAIIVKRLQVVRTKPPRVKIISDNPNHPAEEVAIDDIEIVGKIIIGLKRF